MAQHMLEGARTATAVATTTAAAAIAAATAAAAAVATTTVTTAAVAAATATVVTAAAAAATALATPRKCMYRMKGAVLWSRGWQIGAGKDSRMGRSRLLGTLTA
jgi:hypothetical protein